MADNVSGGLPNAGKTYHGGTPASVGRSTELEGTEMKFRDEVRVGNEPRRRRSGRFRLARLVRNDSGVTLLPGRAAAWKTNFRGTRVGGYTAADGDPVAGIVDPDLPAAGVKPSDLFWLFREGPSEVDRTGLTDVAAEAALISAASGLYKVGALTSVANAVNNIGRVIRPVVNNDGQTTVLIDLKIQH